MTFLIISIIVFNLIAILIPKRLTRNEMFSTCLFAVVFELSVDIVLDLKYDLYGYFNKGVDYAGFIPVFGLYPATNILILNYFPKGLKSQLLYILAWSVWLTIYEWASLKSCYFYHTTWKLRYSFVCYLVIFLLDPVIRTENNEQELAIMLNDSIIILYKREDISNLPNNKQSWLFLSVGKISFLFPKNVLAYVL